MQKVAHRSSEDEQWQELKEQCRLRDNGLCRCCIILTPEEIQQRNKQGIPQYLFTPCDVAHVESVGQHVEKTYDLDNVVYMCRADHDALDSFRSPVTGKAISKEEHQYWWDRILKGSVPNKVNNNNSNTVSSYLDQGPTKSRFDPEAWLDS